jgi:hypothetical protein
MQRNLSTATLSTAYEAESVALGTRDSEGRRTPPVVSVPWEQHAPPQATQPGNGPDVAKSTATGGPGSVGSNLTPSDPMRGHVFVPNSAPTAWESSRVLSQWEGTVVEVQSREFLADLRDLLEGEREYSASVPLEEVPAADRPLVQTGAVFDWVIGIRIEHGTQETFSRIVFRRLPAWGASELRRLEQARGSYDDLFTDGQ